MTSLAFPGENCPNVIVFLLLFIAHGFKKADHKSLLKEEVESCLSPQCSNNL